MDSRKNRSDIDCVALGPDGEYFISAKNGRSWWGGMTQENMDMVANQKGRIKFIDFGGMGAFICRNT